jgi:hypothetical protein
MAPVVLFKAVASEVRVGGAPVVAMYGPIIGGFIINPPDAVGQGIPVAEEIYVDITGPATLGTTGTSVAIQPGQEFKVPPGETTNVSVNAATSHHKFSAIIYQPPTPFPPAPQTGAFPPAGPTTVTTVLPSYLYVEYNDDDDLQAFVASYNAIAQGYVSWFVNTPLAVYTSASIFGMLLDWIAAGIYGMIRPALSSGQSRDLGPLNTYTPNELALNHRKRIGPTDVTATTDDIFKRIMTWNFYKGDGNVFNARWLKRRVMRFLIGTSGTAPNIDQTYAISVTFGKGVIAIRITVGTRKVIGGALPNRFRPNNMTINHLLSSFTPSPYPPFPFGTVLKEAMDSGALIVPFQYQIAVSVG